ncbi:MAG TPA: SLC13 family permease [Rheinheimera sp.]|uniref:SLC13 family permease n=1 Tax=Rheinheimera sp. TaxID=1869214 RepID=UPI002F953134
MKQESQSNQTAGAKFRLVLLWPIVAAFLLAGLVYWFVLPQGERIAGALSVTMFAAVLWITEALPLSMTAILIPVALAIVGVFEVNNAFQSFGSPVLFLVLGGYALAVAVEVNGVDRRLARYVLGMAGNRSISLLIAFMLISAVLSMFISNTATTALLLPVVIGIINRQLADKNLSRVLLLGVAYGASIGGVATLIGSPPNAIAAGLLNISYLEWLACGMPVSFTMLLTIPVLWWTYRPEQKHTNFDPGEELPMTLNGKRTLWVIALTLMLWLFGPMLGEWLALPAALIIKPRQ